MAVDTSDHHTNGSTSILPDIDASKVLPGTTFPINSASTVPADHASSPISSEGPLINGRTTTADLYTVAQLQDNPILSPLTKMINHAFSIGHSRNRVLPANLDRLQHDKQFLEEVSQGPGSFTYIVRYTEVLADDPFDGLIATGGAYCFSGKVVEKGAKKSNFIRQTVSGPDVEEWEIKLLASVPAIQKQGLASWILRRVEQTVEECYLAARKAAEAKGEPYKQKLNILLSTIKEEHHDYYTRRGYGFVYESSVEKGWMGSETGFTVSFYTKPVEV